MGDAQRITKRREADEGRFANVLADCVARLEAADIRHAIMGGLAVASQARPRYTHDIDVFLRPRDAVRALDMLAEAGYETERTDPVWIFKAVRDDVTVDLIFRSTGDLYFDDDLEARTRERELLGVRMRVVGPEDLVVIKSAAHIEDSAYHWFDALAILATGDIDWEYLVRRARRSARKVLSLLVYADSEDVFVPRTAIGELVAALYPPTDASGAGFPAADASPNGSDAVVPGDRSATVDVAALRAALRDDPRTDDLDIDIELEDGTIVLVGDVATAERRDALGEVAATRFPGCRVENRTRVLETDHTPTVERLS